MRHLRAILALPMLHLAAMLATSCGSTPEPLATATASLSAAQCSYFQAGGTVTICHATSSVRNPVVKIKVASAACVEGHSQHTGDYVATNDDCGENACLAEGAPCDSTLRCCGGTCNAGVCSAANLCADVTCSALDQCHDRGVCDPGLGTCSSPAKADGAACDDDNACTLDESCQGGSCVGSGSCICAPASTASCYDGPDGTAGVGTCVAGTKTCNESGTAYGACVGAVTPIAEVCGDALDNDCDGALDVDACAFVRCAAGTTCQLQADCGAACVPVSQNSCTTSADCMLVDNFCGGCACLALATSATPPSCTDPVQCTVQPCSGKTVACESNLCVVALN